MLKPDTTYEKKFFQYVVSGFSRTMTVRLKRHYVR
jgi:hypothetical protein